MRAPLTKLARASGALAMVAVDQREALRGMFAAHQSTPVPDSQLTPVSYTHLRAHETHH
jgi:sulfofructosephosphate aldolase